MRACAPVEMMIVCAAYSSCRRPTRASGSRREVDAIDVGGDELGAEAHGLLAELRHELGPEDPVGETREVLDVGGEHELAAGADALDHERVQVGARGVDRGGEAGRARSDDDDFPRVHWASSACAPGSVEVRRLRDCAWSSRTTRRPGRFRRARSTPPRRGRRPRSRAGGTRAIVSSVTAGMSDRARRAGRRSTRAGDRLHGLDGAFADEPDRVVDRVRGVGGPVAHVLVPAWSRRGSVHGRDTDGPRSGPPLRAVSAATAPCSRTPTSTYATYGVPRRTRRSRPAGGVGAGPESTGAERLSAVRTAAVHAVGVLTAGCAASRDVAAAAGRGRAGVGAVAPVRPVRPARRLARRPSQPARRVRRAAVDGSHASSGPPATPVTPPDRSRLGARRAGRRGRRPGRAAGPWSAPCRPGPGARGGAVASGEAARSRARSPQAPSAVAVASRVAASRSRDRAERCRPRRRRRTRPTAAP